MRREMALNTTLPTGSKVVSRRDAVIVILGKYDEDEHLIRCFSTREKRALINGGDLFSHLDEASAV